VAGEDTASKHQWSLGRRSDMIVATANSPVLDTGLHHRHDRISVAINYTPAV